MPTLASGVRRWAAVGRSDAADSAEAGYEAARDAVADADPALLIVFAGHQHDNTALLRGLRRAAPDVPLVGCSTAGEIAASGPGDGGVVVMALGGPGSRSRTASGAIEEHGDLRAAARAAAARPPPSRPTCRTACCCCSPTGSPVTSRRSCAARTRWSGPRCRSSAAARATTSRCAHVTVPRRPGASRRRRRRDDRLGRAARHRRAPRLAPRRRGDARHRAATPTGCSSSTTQPALDVYLDRLDAPAEARTDPAAFTRFALTHPLGPESAAAAKRCASSAEADFEDRSLVCIAEVPQGGLGLVHGRRPRLGARRDRRGLRAGARRARRERAAAACSRSTASPGAGVLGDEGITREVDRIAAHATDAPVAGFYTYGEIARTTA